MQDTAGSLKITWLFFKLIWGVVPRETALVGYNVLRLQPGAETGAAVNQNTSLSTPSPPEL